MDRNPYIWTNEAIQRSTASDSQSPGSRARFMAWETVRAAEDESVGASTEGNTCQTVLSASRASDRSTVVEKTSDGVSFVRMEEQSVEASTERRRQAWMVHTDHSVEAKSAFTHQVAWDQ